MPDRTDTFYPAAGAIHGYGAQLLVSNGAATPVFEAIAGLVNITPGEMSTEDIDRTHLRSPDAHKEHMPGLRDSAAFSCDMIWLPTEPSQSNLGGGTGPFLAGGLISMWRDRQIRDFKIILNDGKPAEVGPPVVPEVLPTEWPFKAYVSKFQPGEIGTDDKIDATAEFQPVQAYDADLP